MNFNPWLLAGFELKCAVTRVYGTALESKIQEAVKGNGTVKNEIKQLQSGDCIISFNYDLLAEKILRQHNKKVAVANPYSDTTNLKDAILLCKPHGSLSWKQWSPERGGSPKILNMPMQEWKIDFIREIGANILPGIIGPVPFKDEIIFSDLQLGEVPLFFNLVVAQWRSAIQCISETEKLVVLGYGFPPEDLHAHYLFAEAAAKRESDKELEIEVYEICGQRFNDVKKNIAEVLEPASCKYRCEYKGEACVFG